jgi:small GTP-binding protein
MSDTRTVRYDPADIQREYAQTLDAFLRPFATEPARQALGEQHLGQLEGSIAAARSRLDRDFQLVVLGDFKRGKSTLINALLERELLPCDVTPETVTINHVTQGSSEGAEAVLKDGGIASLTLAELRSDKLVRVLDELPGPVDHLRVRAPVRWLENLRIIDTPGLSDLRKRFDAQVQAYLPQADAVIYVVSALSPLSESERQFLRAHLRPQAYPKLIFVVNMIDAMRSQEDEDRLLGSVREKIQRDFPGSMVAGVSALDELCRIQGQQRPNEERAEALAASFEQLRQHLRTGILLNRELLHVARSLGHTQAVVRQEITAIGRLAGALQATEAELIAAIDEREDERSGLHERIRDRKQAMRERVEQLSHEAVRWIDGFLDRIRAQSISGLHEVPYGDVQRYFPFFFSDSIREALIRCFDAHQPRVMAELEATNSVLLEAMSSGPTALDHELAGASYEATRWGFMDNLYLLGPLGGIARFVFVDGFGRLFGTASNKGGEHTGRSAQYQRQVEAALPEIRRTAAQEIRAMYAELARKIDLELDGWYRSEVEATLLALRQAQTLQHAGTEAGASARAELGRLLTHAEGCVGSLEQLQGKLEHSSVVDSLS